MKKNNVAFNPFEHVCKDKEIIKFVGTIIDSDSGSDKSENPDLFWNECATIGIAALMEQAGKNAESAGRKACYSDFYELYSDFRIEGIPVKMACRIKTVMNSYVDRVKRFYI